MSIQLYRQTSLPTVLDELRASLQGTGYGIIGSPLKFDDPTTARVTIGHVGDDYDPAKSFTMDLGTGYYTSQGPSFTIRNIPGREGHTDFGFAGSIYAHDPQNIQFQGSRESMQSLVRGVMHEGGYTGDYQSALYTGLSRGFYNKQENIFFPGAAMGLNRLHSERTRAEMVSRPAVAWDRDQMYRQDVLAGIRGRIETGQGPWGALAGYVPVSADDQRTRLARLGVPIQSGPFGHEMELSRPDPGKALKSRSVVEAGGLRESVQMYGGSQLERIMPSYITGAGGTPQQLAHLNVIEPGGLGRRQASVVPTLFTPMPTDPGASIFYQGGVLSDVKKFGVSASHKVDLGNIFELSQAQHLQDMRIEMNKGIRGTVIPAGASPLLGTIHAGEQSYPIHLPAQKQDVRLGGGTLHLPAAFSQEGFGVAHPSQLQAEEQAGAVAMSESLRKHLEGTMRNQGINVTSRGGASPTLMFEMEKFTGASPKGMGHKAYSMDTTALDPGGPMIESRTGFMSQVQHVTEGTKSLATELIGSFGTYGYERQLQALSRYDPSLADFAAKRYAPHASGTPRAMVWDELAAQAGFENQPLRFAEKFWGKLTSGQHEAWTAQNLGVYHIKPGQEIPFRSVSPGEQDYFGRLQQQTGAPIRMEGGMLFGQLSQGMVFPKAMEMAPEWPGEGRWGPRELHSLRKQHPGLSEFVQPPAHLGGGFDTPSERAWKATAQAYSFTKANLVPPQAAVLGREQATEFAQGSAMISRELGVTERAAEMERLLQGTTEGAGAVHFAGPGVSMPRPSQVAAITHEQFGQDVGKVFKRYERAIQDLSQGNIEGAGYMSWRNFELSQFEYGGKAAHQTLMNQTLPGTRSGRMHAMGGLSLQEAFMPEGDIRRSIQDTAKGYLGRALGSGEYSRIRSQLEEVAQSEAGVPMMFKTDPSLGEETVQVRRLVTPAMAQARGLDVSSLSEEGLGLPPTAILPGHKDWDGDQYAAKLAFQLFSDNAQQAQLKVLDVASNPDVYSQIRASVDQGSVIKRAFQTLRNTFGGQDPEQTWDPNLSAMDEYAKAGTQKPGSWITQKLNQATKVKFTKAWAGAENILMNEAGMGSSYNLLYRGLGMSGEALGMGYREGGAGFYQQFLSKAQPNLSALQHALSGIGIWKGQGGTQGRLSFPARAGAGEKAEWITPGALDDPSLGRSFGQALVGTVFQDQEQFAPELLANMFSTSAEEVPQMTQQLSGMGPTEQRRFLTRRFTEQGISPFQTPLGLHSISQAIAKSQAKGHFSDVAQQRIPVGGGVMMPLGEFAQTPQVRQAMMGYRALQKEGGFLDASEAAFMYERSQQLGPAAAMTGHIARSYWGQQAYAAEGAGQELPMMMSWAQGGPAAGALGVRNLRVSSIGQSLPVAMSNRLYPEGNIDAKLGTAIHQHLAAIGTAAGHRTETPVSSQLGDVQITGTADLVQGTRLVDWKTSQVSTDRTPLQLQGYAIGLNKAGVQVTDAEYRYPKPALKRKMSALKNDYARGRLSEAEFNQKAQGLAEEFYKDYQAVEADLGTPGFEAAVQETRATQAEADALMAALPGDYTPREEAFFPGQIQEAERAIQMAQRGRPAPPPGSLAEAIRQSPPGAGQPRAPRTQTGAGGGGRRGDGGGMGPLLAGLADASGGDPENLRRILENLSGAMEGRPQRQFVSAPPPITVQEQKIQEAFKGITASEFSPMAGFEGTARAAFARAAGIGEAEAHGFETNELMQQAFQAAASDPNTRAQLRNFIGGHRQQIESLSKLRTMGVQGEKALRAKWAQSKYGGEEEDRAISAFQARETELGRSAFAAAETRSLAQQQGIYPTGTGRGAMSYTTEELQKFAETVKAVDERMTTFTKTLEDSTSSEVQKRKAQESIRDLAAQRTLVGATARYRMAQGAWEEAAVSGADIPQSVMQEMGAAQDALISAQSAEAGIRGRGSQRSALGRGLRQLFGGWGLFYMGHLASLGVGQFSQGYQESQDYMTQAYAGGVAAAPGQIGHFASPEIAYQQAMIRSGGGMMAQMRRAATPLAGSAASDLGGAALTGMGGMILTQYIGEALASAGFTSGIGFAGAAPLVGLGLGAAALVATQGAYMTDERGTIQRAAADMGQGNLLGRVSANWRLAGLESHQGQPLIGVAAPTQRLDAPGTPRGRANILAEQVGRFQAGTLGQLSPAEALEFSAVYGMTGSERVAHLPAEMQQQLGFMAARAGLDEDFVVGVGNQMLAGVDVAGMSGAVLNFQTAGAAPTAFDMAHMMQSVANMNLSDDARAKIEQGLNLMYQTPGMGGMLRNMGATTRDIMRMAENRYSRIAGGPYEGAYLQRANLRYVRGQLGLGTPLITSQYARDADWSPQRWQDEQIQNQLMNQGAQIGQAMASAGYGTDVIRGTVGLAEQNVQSMEFTTGLMSGDPFRVTEASIMGAFNMNKMVQQSISWDPERGYYNTGLGLFETSLLQGAAGLENTFGGFIKAQEAQAARIWGPGWQDRGGASAAVYGVQTPSGATVYGQRAIQWHMRDIQARAAGAAAGAQMAQLNLASAFTTGVGLGNYTNITNPQTGEPFGFNTGPAQWRIPGVGNFQSQGGGFWGYQDAMRALQYAQQDVSFDFTQRQMNMQKEQFYANMGLQRQQQFMQRGWTQEDWLYQDQVRGLQWQWRQEDFQEQARFLTGRQRRVAERQMERETIMHGLEGDRLDTQRERQKDLWRLEDERFEMQKRHFEESRELQQEQLALSRKFFEERKRMEEEQQKLQRAYWIEQQNIQRAAAGAAAAAAAEMRQANDDLLELTQHEQDRMGEIRVANSSQLGMLREYVNAMNHIAGQMRSKWKVPLPDLDSYGGGDGANIGVGQGDDGGVPTVRKQEGGFVSPHQSFRVNELQGEYFVPTGFGMVVPKRKMNDPWTTSVIGQMPKREEQASSGPIHLTVQVGTETLGRFILNTVAREFAEVV